LPLVGTLLAAAEAAGKLAEGIESMGEMVVEHLRAAISHTVEFGHALEKTGLSIKTLNALRILGQQNLVDFDQLTLGLTLFNDRIYLAARNGGQAAQVFRDLGVSITDTRGAILPTETVLAAVMDRFRELPDGIQKTALAQELFGRQSRQWLPLLNEGAAALERLKSSDPVFTPEMIEQARQFQVGVSGLKEQFEQLWLRVAQELLPSLSQFVTWLDNALQKSGLLKTAAIVLADALKVLISAVVFLYTEFAKLDNIL